MGFYQIFGSESLFYFNEFSLNGERLWHGIDLCIHFNCIESQNSS